MTRIVPISMRETNIKFNAFNVQIKYCICVAISIDLQACYSPLMKYCTLLVWWAAAFVALSGCVKRWIASYSITMYSMRYLLPIKCRTLTGGLDDAFAFRRMRLLAENLTSGNVSSSGPPVARIQPVAQMTHNFVRQDNYTWLRDDNYENSEVLEYLQVKKLCWGWHVPLLWLNQVIWV